MALVSLEEVGYSYPEAAAPALTGVTLEVGEGICLVAGPSGGGKSTLLRLCNGLVPHLHGGRIGGRVTVAGVDVLRATTRQMATLVGFVFQDSERQAVHATVERDIAFGLENLGCATAEMHRRVHEVAERLGLTHLLARTIASLSGGERQRVAVAGALVLRPRLLVLDEPFAQLDSASAAALLDVCIELRDSGTALLVSEHRLDDLLPAADGVVTVDAGHASGPVDPARGAAGLDSAPQVVRLSRRMGWNPPLLDARQLHFAPGDAPAPAPPPRHPGPPAWQLDDVDAGRGPLLTAVSLAGHGGEVVVLMGVNGSGKTTLLRVIAGLAAPARGTARRDSGRVAYLPQDPSALLHRETVAAELRWTARRARDRDPAADRALARLLGVEALLDRDPRDLSSGQRQRAAVAAVLAGRPRLALLDEPTRGMDDTAREALVAAVRSLAAGGSAVVLATHDSDLAASVADRVVLLEDGSVRDAGPPHVALAGEHAFATQLGRRASAPGPVTVDAAVAWLAATPQQQPVAP